MKVLEGNLQFWSLGRLNDSSIEMRGFCNKSREKDYFKRVLLKLRKLYTHLPCCIELIRSGCRKHSVYHFILGKSLTVTTDYGVRKREERELTVLPTVKHPALILKVRSY